MLRRSGVLLLMTVLMISSVARGEVTASSGQRDKYEAAAQACGDTSKANKISAGLWGAMGALCGYNCFSYFSMRAERTAVQAATVQTGVAAATATACAPVAPQAAVITGQVEAIIGMIVKAETETAKAAAAASSPLKSAAMGSNADVAHEALVAQAEALSANATAAAAACSTAATAACGASVAFGATAALCTACTACAAQMPPAAAALASSATALSAHLASVISIGKVCAYGSFVTAAADIGVSATIGKNFTGGLMGLAGAAPALITLLQTNELDTVSSTASAMGKSSCFTSGVSLILAGVKAFQATKSASCRDDNLRKAKDLSDPRNPALDPTGSGVVAATAPGFSGSEAATTSSGSTGSRGTDSSTSGAADISSSIASASKFDSTLAKVEASQPGRLSEALSRAAAVFGGKPEDFLRPGALTSDKLASMISAPSPESRSGVEDILNSLNDQLSKSDGATGNVSAPNLAALTPSSGRAGGFSLGDSSLSALPGAAPAVEGAGPSSESVLRPPLKESTDELHAGFSGSIFDIVTMRIGKSRERIEKVEWQSPANRFQHGLSLKAVSKKR